MSKKRIYLSPPHMSGMEEKYIAEAFQTNWIAPLGPHVEAFEKELAEYVGVKGALVLNSGTAAIHLALRLLGVGAGDKVFCSTLTFAASANPIIYLGGEPVFIDSELDTWNMSSKPLERAMRAAKNEKKLPKAVIAVNLYGQNADMNQILEICNYYNVPVIEDAAESLGASYLGRASGSIGYLGIYSFNGNKIITTSGGGAIVSNDLSAIEKARFWATQARDPARHYQHSELGYNYRLSNILAGIGRAQLKVIEERVQARRTVFESYYQALSKIEGINFMPEATYGRSNRWLTALTINPEKCGVTADRIMEGLALENIEARPVWKPMHLQPFFHKYDYYPYKNDNSISDLLFAQGLCLPSGSNLTQEEQERVIKSIKDQIYLRKRCRQE